MALFGSNRDISLFRHISRELVNNIIEQQVGYYKVNLTKTNTNIYGESLEKFYNDPVLLKCLITRQDQTYEDSDNGPDINRSMDFAFLRDDLILYNVYPEDGDVILWNNDFFEVDNMKENQLVVGKYPEYSYTDDVQEFGSSWSIVVGAHYTRAEKLNIIRERL